MTDETPVPAGAPALAPAATTSPLTTPPPPLPAVAAPAPKPTLVEALYEGGDATRPLGDSTPAEAPAPTDPAAQPADAAKPAEGDPPKAEPEAPTPLTAASYADLALPEGLTVDAALFDRAKETFASVGVDPTKAPALLALFNDALTAQNKVVTDALAHHAQQQQAYTTEFNALPEFQGERRAQSVAVLGRALEEFAPNPARLRADLDASGMGNHPDLIQAMLKMASMLVEDAPSSTGRERPLGPNGTAGPNRNLSLGQRIYGATPASN